jgi:AGCS family alanine or glycine:cation symporter
MDIIHSWITVANSYLWGVPLLILLFGTHIFLTIRTGLIQKHLWKGIKLSVSKEKGAKGDVSPFGALSTALAATVGTGNIVGVATAVALGGPGAVFWMWMTGVLGIATKYGEALLAVKYRVQTSDGKMLGGPMYALERGLNMKWLGVIFAIFTAIAAFGIGNMTQANSISSLAQKTFDIDPHWTGLFLTIITAVVILGGIRSIARVCEFLVPFMALFYVTGCLIILALNASFILPAAKLILVSAFTPTAAGGGFVGATILMAARYGIARGLFSNESGLGSAPIVAAAAQSRNPVRQALVSATGTFWDTVVICAITGLVIVSGVLAAPEQMAGLKGGDLTHAIFDQIPVIGPIVLTVGLLTFVFSTILGWSYYGERALEYLVGKRGILPYRILWVLAVYVGSVSTLSFVWDFADMTNALMAIPNVIALLLLSGVIARETKKYLVEKDIDTESDEEIPKI